MAVPVKHGVWGRVTRPDPTGQPTRLRVEPLGPGEGYLVHTEENGALYDVWLEHAHEVEATVKTLAVEWDLPEE